MENPPRSVIAVLALILLIAGFWLVFAMIAALGLLPGLLTTGPGRWVMAGLAIGAALVLGILFFLLRMQKKWAFYASLLVLTVISVLSISDQVGLLDWISLIVSLAAIGMLLISRSWYLGAPPRKNPEPHE